MKILHYALGFPPYRSGGLTKLCIDLMVQQAKEGHTVAMLWPGQMGFVNQKVAIKKHKNVRISGQNILSFEVINPLPVPFDEGIADIAAFTKNVEVGAYKRLLNNFQPDVIHVHTLMGLHKSFLVTAKDKKIRLVYCYIADAVSGLFKILLDGQNGEAYNISADDDGLTLGEYAEYIASLANLKVRYEIENNESVSKATFALLDTQKIKNMGWKPQYNVKDGLKRTYLIKKEQLGSMQA